MTEDEQFFLESTRELFLERLPIEMPHIRDIRGDKVLRLINNCLDDCNAHNLEILRNELAEMHTRANQVLATFDNDGNEYAMIRYAAIAYPILLSYVRADCVWVERKSQEVTEANPELIKQLKTKMRM